MVAAERWNVERIGHCDLAGRGDCMGVQVVDGYAYVGHMGTDGVGTSVVDVRDPSSPQLVTQLEPPPGTRSHKVQIVDDLLLVNCERNPWGGPNGGRATSWKPGLRIYDIADRTAPTEVGFFETPGKGVHRMTFVQKPFVYMSASDEGYTDQFFMAADLSDPSRPVEVGRWWFPGMHVAGGEKPSWGDDRRYAHHHPLLRGDRAYAPWWDGGLVILDVSDLERPSLVRHLEFGSDVSGSTHTALPLPTRDVLVVTDEATSENCQEVQKHVRLVDISDETSPQVISTLPVPRGNYCDRGGRFGPHNLHEMRPGTFRSSHIIHLTYFNAGLRIYDVEDPLRPREVAYYVPPAAEGASAIQLNDLTVDEKGTIFVTDRAGGGLYVLEATV